MPINSRIILSGVTIIAAAALTVGASFAFFSDVGQSTNNVFATGSFDLKLTDNDETAVDNVTATFNPSGTLLAPGGASVSGTLQLKNTGTIAGSHVHFKAANTVTDVLTPEGLGPMSKHLQVLAMTYDGGNILPLFTDSNSNGHIDLQDLESGGDGVQIGALTDLNVNHPLFMSIQLDGATDGTYITDSVTATFSATLHQDASQ